MKALTGIISIGLGASLLVFAIQEMGTGPTAILFATSPLFALPLGKIFLRERITWWVGAGTAAAIGGIGLLSSPVRARGAAAEAPYGWEAAW